MQKMVTLAIIALSVLAAPTIGSIGGNFTTELEPEIIGQINQTDVIITPAELSLWMQERTLWQERAFWTRMAIISMLLDSDSKSPVINRLMRNQQDMAETIAPYYGNETARAYGDLIENHLLLTIQLAAAVKDQNQTALQNASNKWYQSADEIAKFETNLSANLTQGDRKALWYQNLNLTKNETMQLFNKDYNSSIDTFDRIEEQANIMADSFANAIILRFPERFRHQSNRI
jgi:hypothetical protein